jgi:hypothetical protein
MADPESLIICTPGGAEDNSYVSLDDADAYFSVHLSESSYWDGKEDPAKEQALISATREIERLGGLWVDVPRSTTRHNDSGGYGRQKFFGTPQSFTQHLHFPRLGDMNGEGVVEVPIDIREACYEQAVFMLHKVDFPDLVPGDELQARGDSSETIDGYSESYDRKGAPAGIAPKAWALVRPFVMRSFPTTS